MRQSDQMCSRFKWSLQALLRGCFVMYLLCSGVRSNAESQTIGAQGEPNRSGAALVVQLEKGPKEETGKGPRFPTQGTVTDAPLEIVAVLDVRPMGIAVSSDDRLFISLAAHLGDAPPKDGVVVRELLPDGSFQALSAFPNSEARSSAESFTRVMALTADSRGVLWILDSGAPPASQPKLVGWDIKRGALHRIVFLPAPITKPNSLLVSVAVDEKRDMAYIADQGRSDFVGKSESAIISVDLKTGLAWRALEDHYSLNADGGDFIIEGEPLLAPDGKGALVRPSLGIVSVASDEERDCVYFGAANGRSVFRIAAEALSDPNLSSAQIGERVQRLGDKPSSHEFFVLAPEQVIVSDVNNNAIGVVGPAGKYEKLASSQDLSWPAAFARGSRGAVYVVSSQFHRAPLFHRGEDRSKRPFVIARFYPRVTRQEPQRAQPVADPKKRRPQR